MGIKASTLSWNELRGHQTGHAVGSSGKRMKVNWTELHHAAYEGNLDKLKEIVESQGADPKILDAKDYYGKSPLYWAAYKGQKDCLKALIDYGTDVDSQCKHGSTALHAVAGLYPECVLLLIKSGADVDLPDRWGVTAMYIAALNGQLESIKLLVLSGAIMTYRNKRTGAIPKQLTKHRQFCSWLKGASQNPHPLKDLCRSVIRKQIGHKRLAQLEQMSLPSSLKNFLLLEDLDMGSVKDASMHVRWHVLQMAIRASSSAPFSQRTSSPLTFHSDTSRASSP